MTDEKKYLSIQEFVNEGFLQEANRLFFHPRGLALSVDLMNTTYDRATIQIWDAREDPEGIIFGEGVIDPKKIKRVRDEMSKHVEARLKLLHSHIQDLTARETDRLSGRNPEVSTELSEHIHYNDRGDYIYTIHGIDNEHGDLEVIDCRRCGMKWDEKGNIITEE